MKCTVGRTLLALLLAAAPASAARAGWEEAGTAYRQGDYETAFREFLALAERGDTKAVANVAVMSLLGQGIPKDESIAVRWTVQAAEMGLAAAQNNLGAMHERGRGVARNEAEAAKWYRRAANQGLATAQSNLAVLYEKGRGVPPDIVLAHLWYGLAAAQGKAASAAARDRLEARMSAAELAEARRLAADWRPEE